MCKKFRIMILIVGMLVIGITGCQKKGNTVETIQTTLSANTTIDKAVSQKSITAATSETAVLKETEAVASQVSIDGSNESYLVIAENITEPMNITAEVPVQISNSSTVQVLEQVQIPNQSNASNTEVNDNPVTDIYTNDTPTNNTPTNNTPSIEVPAPPVITEDMSISVHGDYSVGSVYGPNLSQAELYEVKAAVYSFLNTYIKPDMSAFDKVKAAHDYLCGTCTYATSWRYNGANTAWGALIYNQAQCSGYARAFQALCDAIGVECYYVHSTSDDHQWNVIYLTDGYYIVDTTNDDANGTYSFFLTQDSYYAKWPGKTWDASLVPACPYDYFGLAYFQRQSQITDQQVTQYNIDRAWMRNMYFKVNGIIR